MKKRFLCFITACTLTLSMLAPGVNVYADDNQLSDEYIGSFGNEKNGDGYIIQSDYTFEYYKDLSNRKGKTIGTVDADKDQVTLYSPVLKDGKVTGTLKDKVLTLDGKTYESTFTSIHLGSVNFYGIYYKGDPVTVMNATYKSLPDRGFKVDKKIGDSILKPGETTEIKATYKKAIALLTLVNPYEKPCPLNPCVVCKFSVDETSDKKGLFELDSNEHACGQEIFDELLNDNVYYYTEDKLIYKTYVFPAIGMAPFGEDYGEQILETGGNVDLVMNFSDSKLTEFSYMYPSMYNQNLSSNVDVDTDPEEITDDDKEKIITLRTDIITELKKAFAAKDIEVDIDENTGEIKLDNTILFATDQSDLSDEGKAYLDKIMPVYLSVLFSDKFVDHVNTIRFEGHTDSNGEYGYNMILSEKRAASVYEYCLKCGLSKDDASTLKKKGRTQGFSYSDPIFDENGKEDQAASRRVAIRFLINIDK